MKKIVTHVLVLFLSATVPLSAFSQDEKQKEPHYNYLTLSTSVFTNAIGTFNQKAFFSAEAGRTFGIFDLGLSLGRLNLARNDSSLFAEILPTINVFSKRKFSEALTLGAGHIFNRKENFLTEITNSINYTPINSIVITVYQGNYFFDGVLSTSRAQFMGLSVTYNFIKKGSETEMLRRKSLLN